MFCPICGNKINEEDNFCTECGNKVEKNNSSNTNLNNNVYNNNSSNDIYNNSSSNDVYGNSLNNDIYNNVNQNTNNSSYNTSYNNTTVTSVNGLTHQSVEYTKNYGPSVNYSAEWDLKNKKGGNGNAILIIVIAIVAIFAVIGIIFFAVIAVVANSGDKLVCESSEGNITIRYNDSGIIGYSSNEFTYDLDGQKKYADIVGMDAYLVEFNEWFENNTDGTCEINK